MARRIADNVIPISTPLDVSFFNAWLDFISPLHGLTAKERQVLAYYLLKNYELTNIVSDEKWRARMLNSPEIKEEIRTACNLTSSNLQVLQYKLRKHKIMVDGVIDPKLIPALTPEVVESKEFRLMVRFSINDN